MVALTYGWAGTRRGACSLRLHLFAVRVLVAVPDMRNHESPCACVDSVGVCGWPQCSKSMKGCVQKFLTHRTSQSWIIVRRLTGLEGRGPALLIHVEEGLERPVGVLPELRTATA